MKTGEYQILYIVREGDTLSEICNHFHQDLQWTCEENHIADPDRIYPGQILLMTGLLILPRKKHANYPAQKD